MNNSERRTELRGAREERLLIKVLSCEGAPDLEDMTLSCATADVSAGGLRLNLSQSLPAGALVELWVEVKGIPGKFLLTGLVRWCAPEHGEFVAGIELVEREGISDLADWQALFD